MHRTPPQTNAAGSGLALTWFVLFTPFAEFKVEADLIETGERHELAIDAYCPAITKWAKQPPEGSIRRKSFVPGRIQQPLYPGYLFVGLGPEVAPSAVRAVRGDLEFLQRDGAPAPFPYMPDRLHVEALLRQDRSLPVTVFGLRLQEHFKAFDFTRDRRRAAAAVRRAQITFKSFADLGRFVTEGKVAA